MTDKQHFIDSNIWLYRLLDDERMTVEERARKHQIATEVIDSGNSLIISVQVINEVCSNLLRKKRITELEIQTTRIGTLALSCHSFLSSTLRPVYGKRPY
jgi:predicted nucleic acid-binding protein